MKTSIVVTFQMLVQYTVLSRIFVRYTLLKEVKNMYYSDPRKLFCLAAGILGIALIGLGVFLLATGFSFEAVTIGTIISGIVLLVVCGLTKCMKLHCLACLLLLLITLFLIITGILTILFTGNLVVALILIGLGIIALILDVICLILKLCRVVIDNREPPRYK
jgi:hypothetical protein